MSKVRVLVTDGETRACVAAVRGLADARLAVVSAAPLGQIAAAHWSRAVAERIRTPDPLADEVGFVDSLERAVRDRDIAAVMPGGDASLLAVSRGRARLEAHARLGLPPAEVVRRSLDKAELAAAAARHGLEAPRTVICRDAAEALAAAGDVGYPVVAKPIRSVIENGQTRRRSGSALA